MVDRSFPAPFLPQIIKMTMSLLLHENVQLYYSAFTEASAPMVPSFIPVPPPHAPHADSEYRVPRSVQSVGPLP